VAPRVARSQWEAETQPAACVPLSTTSTSPEAPTRLAWADGATLGAPASTLTAGRGGARQGVVPQASRKKPRTQTWFWMCDGNENEWRRIFSTKLETSCFRFDVTLPDFEKFFLSACKNVMFFLELGTDVTVSSHRHMTFLGSALNKPGFENLARSWVPGAGFSSGQSHLFLSPIGAQNLKTPVPYSPPNVEGYTRTPSHNHQCSAVGAQIISLRSDDLVVPKLLACRFKWCWRLVSPSTGCDWWATCHVESCARYSRLWCDIRVSPLLPPPFTGATVKVSSLDSSWGLCASRLVCLFFCSWDWTFFCFLGFYAATQLAMKLRQERIQVVRSNKVARKLPAESNGTPAMDLGLQDIAKANIQTWTKEE